jgi:hypothetical protein
MNYMEEVNKVTEFLNDGHFKHNGIYMTFNKINKEF